MPDISESLTPKSTQLDAVDLLDGPRTFTVTRADYRPGAEQPVTVHLAEFDRPWKPGKNMRRVLAGCWSKDTDTWAGRRVRLYLDPTVMFGGAEVGGIRVSHLDIEKATKVPIIPTKGKSVMYPVEPLPKDAAPKGAPTPDDLAFQLVANLADCTTEAEVREWGNRAHSRNLLDIEVDGETVRAHVERRLADLAEGGDDQ